MFPGDFCLASFYATINTTGLPPALGEISINIFDSVVVCSFLTVCTFWEPLLPFLRSIQRKDPGAGLKKVKEEASKSLPPSGFDSR